MCFPGLRKKTPWIQMQYYRKASGVLLVRVQAFTQNITCVNLSSVHAAGTGSLESRADRVQLEKRAVSVPRRSLWHLCATCAERRLVSVRFSEVLFVCDGSTLPVASPSTYPFRSTERLRKALRTFDCAFLLQEIDLCIKRNFAR